MQRTKWLPKGDATAGLECCEGALAHLVPAQAEADEQVFAEFASFYLFGAEAGYDFVVARQVRSMMPYVPRASVSGSRCPRGG